MQAGFQLLGPGTLYPRLAALLKRSPAVLISLPTLPGAKLVGCEPGSSQSLALTISSDLSEFLRAPLPATGPSGGIPTAPSDLCVWSCGLLSITKDA